MCALRSRPGFVPRRLPHGLEPLTSAMSLSRARSGHNAVGVIFGINFPPSLPRLILSVFQY